VPQDDADEPLRLMILAVLAKADRPMDANELAERVAAMMGVRLGPERGH
jgi:repressor of nif and glnA expression